MIVEVLVTLPLDLRARMELISARRIYPKSLLQLLRGGDLP